MTRIPVYRDDDRKEPVGHADPEGVRAVVDARIDARLAQLATIAGTLGEHGAEVQFVIDHFLDTQAKEQPADPPWDHGSATGNYIAELERRAGTAEHELEKAMDMIKLLRAQPDRAAREEDVRRCTCNQAPGHTPHLPGCPMAEVAPPSAPAPAEPGALDVAFGYPDPEPAALAIWLRRYAATCFLNGATARDHIEAAATMILAYAGDIAALQKRVREAEARARDLGDACDEKQEIINSNKSLAGDLLAAEGRVRELEEQRNSLAGQLDLVPSSIDTVRKHNLAADIYAYLASRAPREPAGEQIAESANCLPPGVPMGYREAAQDVGAPAGPGALVRRLELVAHFLTGLTYTSNAAAVQEAVAALAALQKRVRELEADRRSLTDALQDKLNAGFAEGVAAGRADLKRLLDAAFGLYDNRRGHHPDNPSWNAPAEWWRTLGEALEPFRALTPSPAPDALLPGLRHVLLHRVLPIDDNNWVQAEILRLSSPPAFLATGR